MSKVHATLINLTDEEYEAIRHYGAVYKLSIDEVINQCAKYCVRNGIEKVWICPTCGEGSIDGMTIEHKPNCDYCERKILGRQVAGHINSYFGTKD